jgi:cation diffusion facilitator CzcD-associated flavoprotein CzcO
VLSNSNNLSVPLPRNRLSGICAAIQLQRLLQLTTYTVFELEADIGGTWLSNTYPGCQSDAPSHLYSYSFAPNYDFSKKFIYQNEVHAYLKKTAKTYNIYDKIQFQTQVTTLQWNEGRQKWVLSWKKNSTGEEGDDEFDVVIHGAGMLRHPMTPSGFEAFEGKTWHSARWDHSVDLTGKRVGVVGTSAR